MAESERQERVSKDLEDELATEEEQPGAVKGEYVIWTRRDTRSGYGLPWDDTMLSVSVMSLCTGESDASLETTAAANEAMMVE